MRFVVSILIFLTSFFAIYFADTLDVLILIFINTIFFNISYNYFIDPKSELLIDKIYPIAYFISFLFIIIISYQAYSIGSYSTPYLPGDGYGYYIFGQKLINSSVDDILLTINYLGYPYVLSWIFNFFGDNVIYALNINMFLLFINTHLIAKSSQIITQNKQVYYYAFIILLLTSVYMATGFMVLKDVFIVFAISISLYSSLNIFYKKNILISIAYLSLALLIISLFRYTYLFAPILIFFIINYSRRLSYLLLPFLIALFVFYFLYGQQFLFQPFELGSVFDQTINNDIVTSQLETSNNSFMANILVGYNSLELVYKILFLPVTFFIQYLTPFNIFDFTDFSFSYFLISKNYNILWFLFVGPLFLYSIFKLISSRTKYNALLIKTFLLGLFFYLVSAITFGGAIPRYSLACFPLIIPLMSYNLHNIYADKSFYMNYSGFLKVYFIFSFFMITLYSLVKAL